MLPEEAYLLALATLPGIGPAGLRRLAAGGAPAAWHHLVTRGDLDPGRGTSGGHRPPEVGRLAAAARATDVARVWAAHRQAGITVLPAGHPGYPSALLADPSPPALLLVTGRAGVLDAVPAVALVGTRSATRYGLGVAAELGAALAATGVAVVSGLALGIDGAAHEGAVSAARAAEDQGNAGGLPVAVVAGPLDRPYPARHAGLWTRVAEAGVIVSEAPIGAGQERWRFPQRNRLLAALAQVVVVVECHSRGGSLATVEAALTRGRLVGAVPGSVRSPASAGTNQLLADGAFPVRDVSDVLVALEIGLGAGPVRRQGVTGRVSRSPSGRPAGGSGREPRKAVERPAAPARPTPLAGAPASCREVVEAALGWEPTSLEHLVAITGRSVAEVSLALEELAGAGQADGRAGWWTRS